MKIFVFANNKSSEFEKVCAESLEEARKKFPEGYTFIREIPSLDELESLIYFYTQSKGNIEEVEYITTLSKRMMVHLSPSESFHHMLLFAWELFDGN